MSFESALREELSSISGLSGKVYPLAAPEGAKPPYTVVISSEGLPDKTLEGYQDSKEVPIELDIIGADYAEMKALEIAIISKIQTFQGRAIGSAGPFIQEVSYDEPVELYEQLPKWYRCNLNGRVNF